MNGKVRLVALVVFGLLVIGGAVVFAERQHAATSREQRPDVNILLAGAVERNAERVNLEQAGQLTPGEVIDWTIHSRNQGAAAARDYKAVGLVPAGTVFVAGSAEAEKGGAVTYSIDGGQSFSAQPTVEQRQADGTIKRVPAPVSRYTHVRYEWAAPLNAGDQVSATYKVRVR